jgi:ABC-type sulfate transport system permease subunit
MQQTKAGSLGKRAAGNRYFLWLLLAPALVFLFVFLVVPMFGLFRASFYEGNQPLGGVGFSLQHYEKFLLDGYYLGVLAETVGFGLASAFMSLLIGFPVGYSLARLPPDKRRWRLIAVILPLTLSLVVVVFGWLVVLGRNGLLNSLAIGFGLIDRPQQLLFNRTAVLVVLVQQFLPFMILSVMSVVAQINPVRDVSPRGTAIGDAGHPVRTDPRLHSDGVGFHYAPADRGASHTDGRQPDLPAGPDNTELAVRGSDGLHIARYHACRDLVG